MTAYPERLLIWNAGVFRNAFIGITNIAPLVFMGWGFVYWAPRYVMLPELDGWYALPGMSSSVPQTPRFSQADLSIALIVSAFPWLFTRWCTSPYVATVRIHLPIKARTSKEALNEFAANLPPETTLEFTTVGPLGLQNRVTTSLAKLSPLESRTGIGNIQRAVEQGPEYKGLYARYRRFMLGTKFYVGGDEGSRKSNAPGIWYAVMEHIQRGPPRRGGRAVNPRP